MELYNYKITKVSENIKQVSYVYRNMILKFIYIQEYEITYFYDEADGKYYKKFIWRDKRKIWRNGEEKWSGEKEREEAERKGIEEIIKDFREAVELYEKCEKKTDETAGKSREKIRRRISKMIITEMEEKEYKEYMKKVIGK
jgi:hypothetical protein